MTTLPQSITQRHYGIVEALDILRREIKIIVPEFINNNADNVPTVIADVTSLNELEKYLEKFKKNDKNVHELQNMVEHPPDTPLGAYLKACKAYIDKFTNQDILLALDTSDDRYPGMNKFNNSVTTFYEKYNGKLTSIISKDDIDRYALARFELIAKRIFMLLYYRTSQSDFDGGKSRSSKKRTTRRRPRRKSTKRLRRAPHTTRK
jgi:hypothetical protein